MKPIPFGNLFSGRSDEHLPLTALDHPRLSGLYQYWDAKRGRRRMPARADLRPEEMRAFLGYVSLIDVEPSPQRFRFRLMGTAIAEAYGRDLSGHYADDVEPQSYRATIIRHFSEAAKGHAPQLHRLEYQESPEKIHRLVRLTLPLSDDDETVNMLVACSIFGNDLLPPGMWPAHMLRS